MKDEDEELEEEGVEWDASNAMVLPAGSITILDPDGFIDEFGALAVQVTEDEGVFYLSRATKQWHLIKVDDGKVRASVSPIKNH